MNTKVKTEIGIVIIIIFAIIFGSIIWLANNKQEQSQVAVRPIKKVANKNLKDNNQDNSYKRFSGSGCYAKNSDGSDNLYGLRQDFNTDNPTSEVAYENTGKGISFKIPYNPSWGNKDCKVEPYVEYPQAGGYPFVEFGRPRAWATSEYHLTFLPQATAQNVIDKAKADVEIKTNPKKMTISGNEVVVYSATYEIIGKKFNYSFSYIYLGSQPEKSKIDELEKIVATAKLN
jgi:hypothetical protein